jgi:hypothetical protein
MAAPAQVNYVTQVGIEATAGTAVPATVRLPTVSFDTQPELVTEQFTAQGYKHSTSSVVHRRMARGTFEGPGDYNSPRYLWDSLVGFAATQPTTPGGATNARQWILSPKSAGADSNAKTLTLESGVNTPIANVQRMTAAKITSWTLTATQDSVRQSGSLIARFPTDGNYLTGNEVQSVTITGTPTGGTFTLTYSGQTTSGIAYNATAATVQAALEALSNIAVGDVSVTGGPGPGTAFIVEFTGTLGNTNVAAMTASGASLTGGSTPGVTIATAQAGAAITTLAEKPISREHIDVFIADSWADLDGATGTYTKITDVYEETLTVGEKDDPFFVHNTTYDSYKETVEKEHLVSFMFRTAHNAQSQAFFNSIEANASRFLRWQAVGNEIDTGVNNDTLQWDFTGKITGVAKQSGGIVYAYEYQFTGVVVSSFTSSGGVWSGKLINALTA